MSIGKVVAICTIVGVLSGLAGTVAVYVIQGKVCASSNKEDIDVLQQDVRNMQTEQANMAGDIGLIQRDIEYITTSISNIEQKLTGVRSNYEKRKKTKKTVVDTRQSVCNHSASNWCYLPY